MLDSIVYHIVRKIQSPQIAITAVWGLELLLFRQNRSVKDRNVRNHGDFTFNFRKFSKKYSPSYCFPGIWLIVLIIVLYGDDINDGKRKLIIFAKLMHP